MKPHFEMMARYNAWANARLYAMAAALPAEAYHRNVGAYFKSLHGTLNHLVATDRIWLWRITGQGAAPDRLDAIVAEDFTSLRAARIAEDRRISDYVDKLTQADLEAPMNFHSMNGAPRKQLLREVLAHLFNHQTHHRGQAHAILTQVGVTEPESLDLMMMLWLESQAQ